MSQQVPERILQGACDYADQYDFRRNPSLVEEAFQKSINQAIEDYLRDPFASKGSLFETPEGLDSLRKAARENLMLSCPRLRIAALTLRQKVFYAESHSPEANKSFQRGELFVSQGNFKAAIKEFSKAVKSDDAFVMGYDNLSICYFQLKDFKKAASSAEKSLEIFPEGSKALWHAGNAYFGLKDAENSQKYYKKLSQLYPEEPEGYLGMARVAAATAEWQNALDNANRAHRIYQRMGSPMQRETQSLIDFISREMSANPLMGDTRTPR